MIEGIVLKDLTTHTDERGYFREIIRQSDDIFEPGFGQWSHSMMFDGVIKAWHIHQIQTDWWYVVAGVLRVGLADVRPDSPTNGQTMDFLMGDFQSGQVLSIPPGIAHGCKVVQGPAHLLYVTSQTYNPEDEGRIAFDEPTIDFDWLAGPEIK